MSNKKIYYIYENMPYVEEDELNICGCGGKPVVNFVFDYDSHSFKETEVYCKKCGITTGIRETIDKAINVWQKCFEPEEPDYSEYYEVCTGCSGNFGKD